MLWSAKIRITLSLTFAIHISIAKDNSERLLPRFNKLSQQMLRSEEFLQLSKGYHLRYAGRRAVCRFNRGQSA